MAEEVEGDGVRVEPRAVVEVGECGEEVGVADDDRPDVDGRQVASPLRDLRAEVYSPGRAAEYEVLERARPGWPSVADAHGVRAVVVRVGEPLDRALGSAGGWTRTAGDATWSLWTR
ncbi:MAG: hypothetical protein LCH84_19375 [Gemmatimonadetes bacterium]|nr:hypothetical protein [Gemmatimonadota bacterium]